MPRTLFMTTLVALVLTTSTAASADTYFGFGSTLEESNMLKLGQITSDADGVVEIYDFHGRTVGELLGTQDIHAGANSDVRVHTRQSVRRNIIAVVRIGGQVVVEKEFNVEDH